MKFIAMLIIVLFSRNGISNTTLFTDFGDKEKIIKVVDDMFIFVSLDERISPSFKNLDMVKTKNGLVEFLCQTMEGPCNYTGQNMKRAHKGHEITAAHFFALTEALQSSMEKNKIPQRVQNKLIAKLAPMQKDIINK